LRTEAVRARARGPLPYDSQALDSESLSSLLAATVAFAIGTSVVLRDRSRQQTVRLAVFCFNLGLYHLARFFHGFVGGEPFAWFAPTMALLLPSTADRVLASFVPSTGTRRWQPGSGLRTTLGFGLFVAQTIISLGLHELDRSESQWAALWEKVPWWIVPWLIAGYVILGLLLASMRLWWASRTARHTALAPRLRYLFYASLVALGVSVVPLVADSLGFGLGGGVGPIVTAVYLYFVEQTLRRERLLDLPEIATRILSLSLLVVVVTGLYAALLVWIDRDRSLFLFNAAVASFAVVILLEPVRREIDYRIEGWLFHDRPVLRRMLVRLRQRLLNVIDVDEMARLVIESLESSGRVTQASLYLLNLEGTAIVLQRWVTANDDAPPPLGRLDLATRRPLLERMQTQGTVLRDELERERERAGPEDRAELQDMLDTLGALEASLALPILGRPSGAPDDDPEVLGALFVDDQRLVEPFAREEVELFEGVVAQAATTVQNSAVYEARKERERLAALGEMAAGLAHEIRNPLGAMKGAVQVLRPPAGAEGSDARLAMDEQTREFLDIILEEVDRLNRVVTQFLTYSRPFKGELAPIDLREVVSSTLRLLPEGGRARVRFELDAVPPELPLVRGDPDALRQVVLNLVLNGLDAIGDADDGAITMALSVRRRGLHRADAVALDVCDNGPGLSAQTMTNLFVPFHTTKTGGTGLGLPISQRIVQNHHGAIEVGRSAEDGARFTVLLPVADGDAPAGRANGGPPTPGGAGSPAAARVALP
jgi:two-component system, NtrC family, sensor histidine kinase HydH